MRRMFALAVACCLILLSTSHRALPPRQKWGVGYSTHEEVRPESIQATIALNAHRVRTWGHGRAQWWVGPLSQAGMVYHSAIFKPPLTQGKVPESFLAQLQEEAQINPGSEWIYGNEPEFQDISPQDGALAYAQCRDAILEVDPSATFIVGNVLWLTRWSTNYGEDWLREFLSALDSWDAVAGIGVHIYLDYVAHPCPVDAPSAMLAAVEEVEAFSDAYAHSLPIYITEIGQLYPQCRGQALNGVIIREVLPALDADDRVAAHFWFATMADSRHDPGYSWCEGCLGSLLEPDLMHLSLLGKVYAGEVTDRAWMPLVSKGRR